MANYILVAGIDYECSYPVGIFESEASVKAWVEANSDDLRARYYDYVKLYKTSTPELAPKAIWCQSLNHH